MVIRRDPWNYDQFEDLLQEGITAAKSGRRALAQQLLNKATLIKAADPRPWLWLSATTDDLQEQRTYLERAVAADPSNAAARRGLVMLSEKLDKERLLKEGEEAAPRRPEQPEEAQSQAYMCPQCGGRLQFEPRSQALSCSYCGYAQEMEERLAADSAEQPVDFVLPTTRAHRWAEVQQRVACENCGAVTLLPPGQTADRCPYCASNRMVASSELVELVDPQVIALMKIDAQQSTQAVRNWLGRGFFAPDDLSLKAGGLQIRPSYYPFWTFDGTLEVPWACEVNEGTSKNPRWVARNGTEFEFFDDILVPGMRSMSDREVASVEPFNLKDLLEFSSEYLAGWVALAYDYPMADASLRARQKVMRQVRRDLSINVEPGREKRNLTHSGGKWSGLTFKHVLLPLWVGNYVYQGKLYRLLINGQTGKVGGDKPRDRVKIWLAVGIGLILLALISYGVFLLYS